MDNNMQQNNQPSYTEKDKQTADKLSIISLVCFLVPIISAVLLSGIKAVLETQGIDISELDFLKVPGSTAVLGVIGGYIAGVVLDIFIRVKYPANTFGKVLMWVYIITFIVALIAILLCIVWCGMMIYTCTTDCEHCM